MQWTRAMESRQKQLDHWFEQTPGRELLEMESQLLSHVLPRLFGYHLLQLGGPTHGNWLGHCRIPHKIYLNIEQPLHSNGSRLVADYHELPFLPDSLDVVLLPHVLEFTRHPRQILEEVYDILIPEGYVVILGFHPWSLWGLTRLFKNRKKMPWRGKFYSSFRVRHWLSSIGYEIEDHKTLFFRPPLSNKKWLRRLLFLEATGQLLWSYLGGVYLIVAKKRVEAVTPIFSNSLTRRVKVPRGVAQPTARVH